MGAKASRSATCSWWRGGGAPAVASGVGKTSGSPVAPGVGEISGVSAVEAVVDGWLYDHELYCLGGAAAGLLTVLLMVVGSGYLPP